MNKDRFTQRNGWELALVAVLGIGLLGYIAHKEGYGFFSPLETMPALMFAWALSPIYLFVKIFPFLALFLLVRFVGFKVVGKALWWFAEHVVVEILVWVIFPLALLREHIRRQRVEKSENKNPN